MRKLPLLLIGVVCLAVQAIAQHNVTGRVTDEKGNPISNVSVLVKGTPNGTVTKGDGSYSISVPTKAKALIFSSVDMGTVEMIIGDNNIVNVTLRADDKTMSEVVVVGYGTQKKADVTSAISKVSGDKVANVPLSSIDQILQGKVAGLQSQTFSGQPGANQQIRIRGTGSFSVSSQPLYVIDGIQINSGDLARLTTTSNVLSNINPDDIESITVLKDAAATAIYGSRGGNGVIVVTTKKR